MGWLGLVNDLLDWLLQAWEGFKRWATKQWNDLLNFLYDNWQKLKSFIYENYQDLKRFLYTEWVDFKKFINDEILKPLQSFGSSVWNLFVYIGQQITNILIILDVKVKEATAWAGTELSKLKDNIFGEFDKFKKAIEAKIPDVKEFVGTAIADLLKSIKDGTDWFVGAVFGVLNPFLNEMAKGIKDGWYEETGVDLESE